MWQFVLRISAKFFCKKNLFEIPALVRLILVLVFVMFMTPPHFADAKKNGQVLTNDHKLPMPSVRFVRTHNSAVSKLPPTPAASDGLPSMQQTQATPVSFSAQPPSDQVIMAVNPAECAPWDYCEQRPTIQIHSTGQIKNSKISKIQVQVGTLGKIFDGDTITIRLPLTSSEGDQLNYWAITEDGTRSSPNTLKYLSYKMDTEQDAYYFALLGTEWNTAAPNGSLLWQMFPPIGSAFPSVLEKPLTAGYLYTTNHYSYLAGHLIISGKVNAKSCADGGVYKNGYATPCGEQQAAEKVLEWQNRYDKQIFDSSVRNHIPAKILKAMIAQETQFWSSTKNPYEIGLGSLTEYGLDMLLTWNKEYFFPLCIDTYGKKACAGGYPFLNSDQQGALKQIVWKRVSSKEEEIDVLGAVFFASAAQVNQMVNNTTYTSPGEVATYEDMWKITVANYHSGSGCVGNGMKELTKNAEKFTWKAVSSHLLGDCNQAVTYVDNVWRYAGGQP